MARGARQTLLNNANTGFGNANQFNTQLEGQNQQLQNYLVPQYQNLIQNPGFDQATKNAITANSTGAAAATYGSAADQAARTAARTGNSASLAPALDKLAQDKAQTMASTNAQNQIEFAKQAKTDVQQGLQGMSGLYGMDTNLLSRALGIPPEYLSIYSGQTNSPWTGFLQNAISGAGQTAATALGA